VRLLYPWASVETGVVMSMVVEGAEDWLDWLGHASSMSVALVEAILQMSDDAIVTCDGAGCLTSWSPAAERLFGLASSEALGRHFDGLFLEDARPDVGAVVAAALAGDCIRRFECEGLRPDGMPVPVAVSLCPLALVGDDQAVGDDPAGVVMIVRDVTEQRLAQAALAEVEAHLEEAEALSHVGSWLWDVRTGAVQWSGELHRIMGIDPLEFDGTLAAHLALVHPEERQMVAAAMKEAVEAVKPFGVDCRIRLPDGGVRVVHFQARPTIGSKGVAIGLRGLGYEVSGPTADRDRSTA